MELFRLLTILRRMYLSSDLKKPTASENRKKLAEQKKNRLAKALRENLRKRNAQMRGREEKA